MPSHESLQLQTKSIIRSTNLVYMDDAQPGYTRKVRGRGFEYFNADGTKVTDKNKTTWMNDLMLPPAWQEVWISPLQHGHLLATGRDVKQRKQYRYHPKWTKARKQALFANLPDFAAALPSLREQVNADMRRTTMCYERVVAASVYLLDATLLRIGNQSYSEEGHYGLTTLQQSHVDVNSSSIAFDFVGKSGKHIQLKVSDARACRFMQRCHELPGQELLQYRNGDTIKALGSSDINEYLQRYAGDFTAKDFRTWGGTVAAADYLAAQPLSEKDSDVQKTIVAAVKAAAQTLQNTPATARAHYIAPKVFDAYQQGDVHKIWRSHTRPRSGLDLSETRVAALLATLYNLGTF